MAFQRPLALALLLAVLATPAANAQKKYGPGASDREIKLGQTMPYSGPASAYGAIGRAELAYFAMVNEQGGTAYAARIADPGMQMGGKSGTSQVRHISQWEREHGLRQLKDVPWHERDHALFISFAPVTAPRYVCAVVVEHGHTATRARRRLQVEEGAGGRPRHV